MKWSLLLPAALSAFCLAAATSTPDSELIRAASKGQTQQVRELLAHGASVNAKHALTGWTALTAAAFYGFPDTVKVLLDAGADPNARDLHGGTPLMKAVTVGHTSDRNVLITNKSEVIRLLLKGGADPQMKDSLGDTPWEAAITTEEFDLVDVFENAGVKGVAEAKLLYGASHHDVEKVQKLIAAHVNVNCRDEFGWNAVSGAVLANDSAILKLLIAAGADVNARYEKGWTALMIAVTYNRVEIAKTLLAAGADPRLETEDGVTALAIAKQQGNQDLVTQMNTDSGADKHR